MGRTPGLDAGGAGDGDTDVKAGRFPFPGCMGLALCACSLVFSQSVQSSQFSQGVGAFPSSPASPATQTSPASQAAQESRERELTANELQRNLLLALSSPDYRVTPGDVYALSYVAVTAPVALRIVVDSSYRAQIANLGAVSAVGKTYRQLKAEAEAIVSNNYPLGGAWSGWRGWRERWSGTMC